MSSFGISGTNAHVIVQQAPTLPDEPAGQQHSPPLWVWPISARTPTALAAQAQRLHQHLLDHPELDLTDLAYSLASTRTHHPYRATLTSSSEDPRADLLDALQALTAGRPHPRLTQHHTHGPAGKTVFVLPGQGAQYPGMGVQLYQHHRGFARALDECDAALGPFTGWSVREVLRPRPGRATVGSGRASSSRSCSPSWCRWPSCWVPTGSSPEAVIGHSQGEIAAAHLAGVFTLE